MNKQNKNKLLFISSLEISLLKEAMPALLIIIIVVVVVAVVVVLSSLLVLFMLLLLLVLFILKTLSKSMFPYC